MGIDIAICVIVFVSAVCYAHIGFVRSAISVVSWVACLACGLFFCDEVRSFIYDSGVGRKLETSIAGKLTDSIMDSSAVSSAPSIIRNWVGIAADSASGEVAQSVTNIILTIFSFLLLMLAVKIVLFVIVHLLSKQYNDGPLAFIDSTAGLVLGIGLGVFYVLLLLAALVLVLEFLPDSTAAAIRNYLDHSYFSGIMYDNNPLFILFRYAKDALIK